MIIQKTQINANLQDIIIELKSQLALNGLQLFYKIHDAGKDIQVCCPYHKDGQERRPSAGIRKEDGLFHCFTCGEIHSFPEVVSHCFGKEDAGVYGWSWLLKNFGTVEKEERKDIQIDFSRTHRFTDSDINMSLNRSFVTEEELAKYRYIHPYMYKRRLTDDVIELFDIGYDTNTHCITFPVRDIRGNTLFIARRSVFKKYFNYPRGVVKPLYGIYELYTLTEFPKEVIVCESMFDALTAWVYGSYAVAFNGLGNSLQFKQLSELPCRELILATDNDEAGETARVRIRKNIKGKLITQFDYFSFPDGAKDLNDLTEEQFKKLEKIF